MTGSSPGLDVECDTSVSVKVHHTVLFSSCHVPINGLIDLLYVIVPVSHERNRITIADKTNKIFLIKTPFFFLCASDSFIPCKAGAVQGCYAGLMAYSKTVWKTRQGVNLNRFLKAQETETSVLLTNTPDSIAEQGTPFSADNMNNIEEGIAGAYGLIEAEEQARQQDKQALQESINNESQARQQADQALRLLINDETQDRQQGDQSLAASIAAVINMIEELVIGELPPGFVIPLVTIVEISGPQTVIPLSELGITFNPVSKYAVFVSPNGNHPEFLPIGAELLQSGLHIYAQRLIDGQIVPGTRRKRWGSGKWGDGSKWGEFGIIAVNILIKEL